VRRRIGASRTNGSTDIEMLEHFQRDDLNRRASRAMAVLHPLKLVIDNYPEGQEEFVEVANNPEDPSAGTRQVPFSREIYIEQDDFREVPPPKYYRLSPGKEVRLRNAYFVTAQSVVKDAPATSSRCTAPTIPASRGGNSPDGRKVKSTMHWVSAAHAISAEIRLYDKLFTKPDPYDLEEGQDVLDNLNPNSLEILTGAKLEPSLAKRQARDRFQFERVGYFCLDPDSLRASWSSTARSRSKTPGPRSRRRDVATRTCLSHPPKTVPAPAPPEWPVRDSSALNPKMNRRFRMRTLKFNASRLLGAALTALATVGCLTAAGQRPDR
jgi:hypothetical protein